MASDKPNSENIDATIFGTSTPPMNANDPPNSSTEGVDSNNVSQPAIEHTGTTSGTQKHQHILHVFIAMLQWPKKLQ